MSIEGRVIATRYAVGELLGRGGMAEVYLATDRVLDRPVALKVLGSWLAHDASFVERFRREALAAARISHAGLVAVYDAGSDDDLHFIVMEHVPGETLADVLRRDGRLPADRARAIAARVGEALAVAHAAGIVHRDVKPANVMIASDGGVRLMDLGIARGIEGDSITRASSILGTAGYISPEQARGEPVDHRSDIYSLGCVLYEMLTGRQPFEADTPVAVAYKHVHEAPVPPTSLDPSIPSALEAATLRAMEKDPSARFPSVTDMTAALDDATEQILPIEATRPLPVTATQPLPVTATQPLPATAPEPDPPTTPLPRRTDRSPRRPRLVPLLAILMVLALLGALAIALISGDPPAGGRANGSPSRSASPSPTDTPSPSTPPPDSVDAAAGALQTVVADGVAAGRISPDAEEEILKRLDEALEKFSEGDMEHALEELDHLQEKVDEFIEHGQIHNSQKQRIAKAIEDLRVQMEFVSSSDED